MDEQTKNTIVVDVDGTICELRPEGKLYSELKPNLPMIEKLREFRELGYSIILYTARNMNTYNERIGLINKHTAPELLKWLDEWQVPYDEVVFGKPWAKGRGFYIDDKAIRPDEFLNMSEKDIHTTIGLGDS